jgi:hypothetical protein
MKTLIGLTMVMVVCVLVAGCSTYSYGPFTARTLATNADIKNVSWTRVVSGTNQLESLVVNGYARDEVKGTKTLGNLIGMISGGLIGSASGPATAVGGAIAGGGAADLLQRFLDGLKQSGGNSPAVKPGATTNSPAASLCGCDLSGLLVDGPYDAAYMSANSHYEECNIEPATGLMVRYAVWIPGQNGWWMQSSIAEGHVKKVGDSLVAECHSTKGFRYHVRGFAISGPRTGESTPALVASGNECKYDGSRRYVIVECRKQ